MQHHSADTIPKQKAYVASQLKQLTVDMALFKRVYRHAFVCSKEPNQKALPLENALVYWEMLFTSPGKPWVTGSGPSTINWTNLWIEFLKEKWTKTVNKDMWNQTFEFFQKTMQDDTLSFWSEDGAWPGVIDDFVAYVKKKRGELPDTMETD
jgi:DCN1-like protein 1/2